MGCFCARRLIGESIDAVRQTAAEPICRLGESIELTSSGGQLITAAGWHSLGVRAHGDDNSTVTSFERVGVGEVHLVVGQSVAQGGPINLPGADDDRVNTIALPAGDMESQRRYPLTGNPRFLPETVGRHFKSNVAPAPAGRGR